MSSAAELPASHSGRPAGEDDGAGGCEIDARLELGGDGVGGEVLGHLPKVRSEAADVEKPASLGSAGRSGGPRRLLDCTLGFATLPCQLQRFIRLMYHQFGLYVLMAVLQYGVNQGMSEVHFAMKYFYRTEHKLDGATMGRYMTAARLPWNVKPLMGLLSDSVPIFGYHRAPYVVLGASCGAIAYVMLGSLPLATMVTVPLYLMVNFSIAAPDVVIDARAAELCKEAPDRASDLQSLSWGSLAIGSILAAAVKGSLLQAVGAKTMLLCLVVCSLSILVPALLGGLPERRLPKGQRCRVNTKAVTEHPGITVLALYMSLAASMLSVMQVAIDDPNVRGIVTVTCGFFLAVGIYFTLQRISPLLAKTALFIFLRPCLMPGLGESMFVWLTEAPEGPHFSPIMLGWIDVFGSVALLAGVTLYNKFLTGVPYRKIFLIAQIATFFASLFDVILVKRWNLLVGVPDYVFVLGDDAFSIIFSRFFDMPMYVLASKVCPDNIEATLFATLMSLSNFGHTISNFAGVTLCEVFGVVGGNFDMLPEAIITKSLSRLLPIPLILLLVPTLAPTDPVPMDDGPQAGKCADVNATSECGNNEISVDLSENSSNSKSSHVSDNEVNDANELSSEVDEEKAYSDEHHGRSVNPRC